ncbi:hypothetical protein ACIODW_19965 [Streptomyces sp. NPDC087897]|uniref:hypothetical protein n=1 Tax=Streptomyces sp. NPDC087897 TaxID=3365817 RepID=UPI003810A109
MDEETDHPEQPDRAEQPAPSERPGGPDLSEGSGRSEHSASPEQPAAGRVVCARCGTVAAGDTAPPTWLCSREDGRRLDFCESCARLHIRAIESRLDSLWW